MISGMALIRPFGFFVELDFAQTGSQTRKAVQHGFAYAFQRVAHSDGGLALTWVECARNEAKFKNASHHVVNDGLLITHPVGPEILSGGAYGLEASLVSVGLLGAVALIGLCWAHKRGLILGSKRSKRTNDLPSLGA